MVIDRRYKKTVNLQHIVDWGTITVSSFRRVLNSRLIEWNKGELGTREFSDEHVRFFGTAKTKTTFKSLTQRSSEKICSHMKAVSLLP